MKWKNSSFEIELLADTHTMNQVRQVNNAHFSYVELEQFSEPSYHHEIAEVRELLQLDFLKKQEQNHLVNVLKGNPLPEYIHGFAMNYGGHQFGQWAGQLGDGRALNIGEINRYQLQLKGSGKTPYSRQGDGKAVLRSSIREYLMAEAMHHLGVPSTRSLSLSVFEDKIERDILYNGNISQEKTALLCRVTQSFVRFGNFEIFAARKELDNLRQLTDYTLKNYFPEIDIKSADKNYELFDSICTLTLDMIIHWQRVGFVHGVMNTDNMSILGLTIDYGPFGFLDEYNPNFTPNLTDFSGKRYRFENQPFISQWNLIQLAKALLLISEEVSIYEQILNRYPSQYYEKYIKMMTSKLGLFHSHKEDEKLIQELEVCLQLNPTDYTLFFREMIEINNFQEFQDKISVFMYEMPKAKNLKKWQEWWQWFQARLKLENTSPSERKNKMERVNPAYILRNYMLYQAIEMAEKGDYSEFENLYEVQKRPYHNQEKYTHYYQKKPDWANDTIGSSVLSCSS